MLEISIIYRTSLAQIFYSEVLGARRGDMEDALTVGLRLVIRLFWC